MYVLLGYEDARRDAFATSSFSFASLGAIKRLTSTLLLILATVLGRIRSVFTVRTPYYCALDSPMSL